MTNDGPMLLRLVVLTPSVWSAMLSITQTLASISPGASVTGCPVESLIILVIFFVVVEVVDSRIRCKGKTNTSVSVVESTTTDSNNL